MGPALLDETLPRPEGFEAHVASCVDCRALANSHRAALRLGGATLTRSHRRPLAEVQRRAGIVAGLVLALGGGVGWYQLEFGGRPAPANEVAPMVELALPALAVEQPEPAQDLFALAELQAQVTAQLTFDPREDEALVRAFGDLPRWTSPTRTHPLRSLGSVASPVVFTSEDSP
jgi:hypothetical protein